MFSLRSKTAEKRVDGFVGEFYRFEKLIHIFKKLNLEFGFVGMVGPFLELSSDDDMNSFPLGRVQQLLDKFLNN